MKISQVKAGIVLNYTTIAVNALVGLLYTPYMLRMMGQSEYGLYSLVASVISYLTLLDLGLGTAIIRYTARLRAQNKLQEQYALFGVFFIIYLIIGLIALGIGWALYANTDVLFGTSMTADELVKARIMMLLLVFNLAFTFPMSLFTSIVQAYERFVFNKAINIVRIVLNTLVMIVLLHFGYKAIAMVIVQTLFNVTTLSINCVYCFRKLKIKILFARQERVLIREIAVFSLWTFLTVIMDKVYWGSGQVVLGIISGTTQVAVYAVAMQLVMMYIHFSTAISTVILPKVTALATTGNDDQISKLFLKAGRLQFSIIFLMLTGYILLGRQFIVLWAGPEYENAYTIGLCLFVPYTIDLIQNTGITILQARNHLKFRSISFTIITCLCIVFEIILSKYIGAVGCALAIGICIFMGQGIVMNIYYWKHERLDIPAFWASIGRMAVPLLTLLILAWFVIRKLALEGWMALCIEIVVYVCCYSLVLFFCSLSKSERSQIHSQIQQLI